MMQKPLITYKFSENYGLTTGIGFNKLSGNAFNTEGDFYQERDIVKIPLLLTIDEQVFDRVNFIGNAGPYAEGIIKDEYQYVNGTVEDYYDSWKMGLEIRTSLVYQLRDTFGFGIAFNGQSDLTKIQTFDQAPFDDEQKTIHLDAIGLLLKVDL